MISRVIVLLCSLWLALDVVYTVTSKEIQPIWQNVTTEVTKALEEK